MPLVLPADEAVEEVESHLPERWRWLTDITIAQNSLWRIVSFAAAIAITLLVGRLLRRVLRAASQRFADRQRVVLSLACAALARASGFFAAVLGLGIGLQFLVLDPTVDQVASTCASVLTVVAIGYLGYCLVDVVEGWLLRLSTHARSRLDDMLAPIVTTSLRVTVVLLTLVQAATVVSAKPVTSVIAGLGVGGLAIGLAAQDTIKNFFGSLMLFSDRPFELGDEIKVGDVNGSVESVGFRSTRFRTAEGFLVTMPNGDLAGKTIVNITRRHNLGRQFNLPLSAEMPVAKFERALAILKEILRDHEGQQPDAPPRVYLGDFAPGTVNLSVAYWYAPPDWWKFVAFNERVNLEVLQPL